MYHAPHRGDLVKTLEERYECVLRSRKGLTVRIVPGANMSDRHLGSGGSPTGGGRQGVCCCRNCLRCDLEDLEDHGTQSGNICLLISRNHL